MYSVKSVMNVGLFSVSLFRGSEGLDFPRYYHPAFRAVILLKLDFWITQDL